MRVCTCTNPRISIKTIPKCLIVTLNDGAYVSRDFSSSLSALLRCNLRTSRETNYVNYDTRKSPVCGLHVPWVWGPCAAAGEGVLQHSGYERCCENGEGSTGLLRQEGPDTSTTCCRVRVCAPCSIVQSVVALAADATSI